MADSIIEALGFGAGSINDERIKEANIPKSVKEVFDDWGNALIKDLQDSLEFEGHNKTSRALFQSIKNFVSQEDGTIRIIVSMLDYYDFTNKGVEGIGGVKSNGVAWVKKPTLKEYRYKSSPIKVTPELRRWAGVFGLSEHALKWSIPHQGIEATQWYDKVVTPERIQTLSEQVAEVSGENLATVLKVILENGNKA